MLEFLTKRELKKNLSTPIIMLFTVLAIVPGIITKIIFFGFGVFWQVVISIVFVFMFDFLITALRKQNFKEKFLDNSSILTAVIIAICIPDYAPWYVSFVACFFAIVIAKEIYGGLGLNIFNPAMVGFIVVAISFPLEISTFKAPNFISLHSLGFFDSLYLIVTGFNLDGYNSLQLSYNIDAKSMATPLSEFKVTKSIESAYFGVNFMVWAWTNFAFFAGGIWLLIKRIIPWQTPVVFFLSSIAFASFAYLLSPETALRIDIYMLSGATIIGAFFIVTDPVTSPLTLKGKIIFAIAVALITFLLKTYSNFPETIAFAVILMNMLTPLIDKYIEKKNNKEIGIKNV